MEVTLTGLIIRPHAAAPGEELRVDAYEQRVDFRIGWAIAFADDRKQAFETAEIEQVVDDFVAGNWEEVFLLKEDGSLHPLRWRIGRRDGLRYPLPSVKDGEWSREVSRIGEPWPQRPLLPEV